MTDRQSQGSWDCYLHQALEPSSYSLRMRAMPTQFRGSTLQPRSRLRDPSHARRVDLETARRKIVAHARLLDQR